MEHFESDYSSIQRLGCVDVWLLTSSRQASTVLCSKTMFSFTRQYKWDQMLHWNASVFHLLYSSEEFRVISEWWNCLMFHFQHFEVDNCSVLYMTQKVPPGTCPPKSLSQTVAVAVVSLSASNRLRRRIWGLPIVSKCVSGTHPQCLSDSLVPSTQSGKKREAEKKGH